MLQQALSIALQSTGAFWSQAKASPQGHKMHMLTLPGCLFIET
jgi:hypothetical protein